MACSATPAFRNCPGWRTANSSTTPNPRSPTTSMTEASASASASRLAIKASLTRHARRRRERLVSCAGNPLKISGEGVEDFFGGLLPDERFGILVPCRNPGSDVGLERLHASVGSAADHLLGQES